MKFYLLLRSLRELRTCTMPNSNGCMLLRAAFIPSGSAVFISEPFNTAILNFLPHLFILFCGNYFLGEWTLHFLTGLALTCS